jgi:iron complex outermembrane receptor protein
MDLAHLDLDALLGSVSTASRRPEGIVKAPAAVTVLERSDIRRSAARTVPDLLRMVPGVQVVQNAPGSYLVSLRGMGGLQGNNVVVLVDGVPVNRVDDGTVDWGALPVHVDDIERIEVVRGPVSPIYGSNAYAGVVNVFTTQKVALGTWGQARVANGADHHGALSSRLLGSVGGNGERLQWQLSIDGDHDSVYRAGGGGTVNPTAKKFAGFGKVAIRWGAHHRITATAGASRTTHTGLDLLVLESRPQRHDSATGMVAYDATDLPGVVDSAGVWLRSRWMSLATDADEYTGFSYDGMRAVDGLGGGDLRFDLPRNVWLAVGGSGGAARAAAPFLHPAEAERVRARYGFYADLGADIRKTLKISGSVRVDDSAWLQHARVSYRAAAVIYRETWALRLAGGSAYREPTFLEMGGRFQDPGSGLILLEGNSGLRAPRVDSAEIGAVIAPGKGPTIKPTVYFAYMRDLMVADFEPLVRKTFRNDGNPHPVVGFELELQGPLTTWLDWRLAGAALWWLSHDPSLAATVGVPSHNSTITGWTGLRGSWWKDRFTTSLSVSYASPRAYELRAGIPPQILRVEVGHRVRPEAVVELQVMRDVPLWLWLRASTSLPHAQLESPLPGASMLGTSAFLGVDFRG